MKKLIALLLFALLMAGILAATAEENLFDVPDNAESGTADFSAGSIQIEINGQPTVLGFDNSLEYSSVQDGTVQASFYAYSEDREYLYELYMIFPESVQTGSTITPEYAAKNAPDCSVVLIISNKEVEQYYFAGQIDGKAYPDGSAYTMYFDSVSASDSGRTYSGRLSAAPLGLSDDSDTLMKSFRIDEAPFTFSMSIAENSDGSEGNNPFQEAPEMPENPFGDSIPTQTTAAPEMYRT